MRVVNRIDEQTEDLHLLGKLRILPEVVLVVVFDDQRDAAVGRVGQAGGDRLGGQSHALVDREFRPPLTREHAAVGSAERVRHVDPPSLLGDLSGPEGRIGMGEVGRTAHHRDRHAVRLHLTAKPRPVGFIGHLKEAGIPFEPIHAERHGQLDPFRHPHRAVLAEGLHEGLGKRGQAGLRQTWRDRCCGHDLGGGGTVRMFLGGLRPMSGCCSRSTTCPLIGPHSSASQ